MSTHSKATVADRRYNKKTAGILRCLRLIILSRLLLRGEGHLAALAGEDHLGGVAQEEAVATGLEEVGTRIHVVLENDPLEGRLG